MSQQQKHSRYQHVFVVLRADAYDEDGHVSEHVTVKKVVASEEQARREVERLNAINSDKACRYYFEIAQFDTGT